ncbi:unnamed protein product [Darwinula stevensoni]|uniref:Uncharacterized protein n=1 Tax=Darwinula stevensoni TaxID=69355 RepID=A0A7R8X8T2_9CRUS|nr:unnamed protein product [Darwinula stevensoni]CAG0884807.1 unnamed protein product [Darwinula stevensoni]
MSASNIAKTLGACRRTVIRAINRYEELGDEGDRPRSGRPRTANTPENRRKLKIRIQRKPRQSMRKLARITGLKRESARILCKKPEDDVSCRRGCRFYALAQVVYAHSKEEGKSPLELCFQGCGEAYNRSSSLLEACKSGCKLEEPLTKERNQKIKNHVENHMMKEVPFDLVASIHHPMQIMSEMMRDMLTSIMGDSALKKALASIPQGGQEPHVVIVESGFLLSPADPREGDDEDDVFGDLPFGDVLPGTNVRLSERNPSHNHRMRNHMKNGHGTSGDWLQCFSEKVGIPRWLLLVSVFFCSLVFVWLCFTSTAPAPQEHVCSPCPSLPPKLAIWENDHVKVGLFPPFPSKDILMDKKPLLDMPTEKV